MDFELVKSSFSNCSLKIWESRPIGKHEVFCDWHLHPEIEISLSITGDKTFFFNDGEVVTKPGDVIFINSKTPHKTETEVGAVDSLLQFDIHSETDKKDALFFVNTILGATAAPYKVFRAGTEEALRLADCIIKIKKEYFKEENYHQHFIKAYLYELIAFLYRYNLLTPADEVSPKLTSLIPVFQYIEEHYTERISLGQMSALLGFNDSHFCRIFKNCTGLSFIEYVNLFRLQKAKKLLGKTEKSITQISYEVGFTSAAYFIKTFKKYNFCSPNKYRKFKPQ